jgi:hypothetical protein
VEKLFYYLELVSIQDLFVKQKFRSVLTKNNKNGRATKKEPTAEMQCL